MKNAARLVVLPFTITIVIAMLVSAACAPSAEITLVSTPEPTVSETAAPTASPTPTAIPTPTIDKYGFTEERKAELNQQFQDFLNKQGEFTQGKMFSMMMEPSTSLDKNEIGLGIANFTPEIQGYFFDYFEKDDRLFMLIGFDGKDGKRFVTPIEIQLYVYKQCSEAEFRVLEYKQNNFSGGASGNSSDDMESIDCRGEVGIMSLLDNFKNKVIVLGLNIWEYKESDVDGFGQVGIDGVSELNSKVDLTFGLFQLIPSNGLSYDNPQRGDASSIIRIETVDDAEKIDILKVPILSGISYFKGILNGN